MDTITFEHEVEGLARPLTVTAEYEPADPSVGIQGGWFLVLAYVLIKHRYAMQVDRDDFEALFGSTALRVAEEAAAELAMARQDEREEVEA